MFINIRIACGDKLETGNLVSFRELCPEITGTRYSTHVLHSYPAQLIPQIPYYFLHTICKNEKETTVLDPFCGAGTVLVEAMHNGQNSIGIDINPLAALIAKVRTTIICKEKLETSLEHLTSLFNELNEDETEEPTFENIDYWFDKKNKQALSKIKHCISEISNRDVSDFFKVIFSSIIKDVSKADPRIYVPVLPKEEYKVDTPDPWLLFTTRAKNGINAMMEFSDLVHDPKISCNVVCADIKNLDLTYDNVDLIITSPPYINAQKYVRSMRLEAYWLGYDKNDQLEINKETIGTERIFREYYSEFHKTGINQLDYLLKKVYAKDKTRAGIASKYFIEMRTVLEKLFAVLNSKGRFVLVVGSNTVTKNVINTNRFLLDMSKDIGFSVERIMIDKIISRGLMTRRNKTANIIDNEWVIQMRKA
jgi:DNA modification methylase